mmetsp:Transcript_61402/g.73860  ORF Transcript_61402/g.73860 Transcript_61402/m.73860 type:complete len:223 (-) Transcript_61402:57-725(-)
MFIAAYNGLTAIGLGRWLFSGLANTVVAVVLLVVLRVEMITNEEELWVKVQTNTVAALVILESLNLWNRNEFGTNFCEEELEEFARLPHPAWLPFLDEERAEFCWHCAKECRRTLEVSWCCYVSHDHSGSIPVAGSDRPTLSRQTRIRPIRFFSPLLSNCFCLSHGLSSKFRRRSTSRFYCCTNRFCLAVLKRCLVGCDDGYQTPSANCVCQSTNNKNPVAT